MEAKAEDSRAGLVVCYISGLDARRLNARATPFLAERMRSAAFKWFVNLPSNELFPTLVSGVDPTVHGIWGVRLHDDLEEQLKPRWSDRVPATLATTWQCVRHFLFGDCDLAAIAPRRRRRFDITRTKYKRRQKQSEALFHVGGVPTVFDVVGGDRSRYIFNSDPLPGDKLLQQVGDAKNDLEILELYSLDRHQQWYGDDEREVARLYGIVDTFLARLDENFRSLNKRLLVLTDHGHEPIRRHVDLMGMLNNLGVADDEYTCFVEVSSARFWFHTDKARGAVSRMLGELSNARVVRWDEMEQFGIPLQDASYGELHVYLDPGGIFFPHDFNQPVANVFFALTDPLQRSRLWNPRHRGNHGHLPHFDAERAFMLVCSDDVQPVGEAKASILDVAPTMLDLVGKAKPQTMPGQAVFFPGE